ncbi:MAG: hypothetical protein WC979_01840 [Candidatus Pacearchaeota archaeon]|nr:hypothetical protein [Clostridia bacterium]
MEKRIPSFDKFIDEKESFDKYLVLLGHDPKKFKQLDDHAYNYLKTAYNKSADASDFEQNFADELETQINKIKI